uniref:Uncharacterized protein n=1 Tax=Daphnia galeata TaxID=27404 RepID=A0A8J2RAL2_9CRUS|nr:unnamed protein product [Daphnia galeata]
MDEESQPKRLKLDDIVSEESSSSDSKESRHSSWQNASTDWVKDSGDDWSPSISNKSASNHSFHEVEFEPESSGTDEINSTSSPSSVKEVFFDPKENCKITDENNEVGIESSEDEFILPVNLKEERKCIICSSLTINPSKYCNDCYMSSKTSCVVSHLCPNDIMNGQSDWPKSHLCPKWPTMIGQMRFREVATQDVLLLY